MSFVPVFRISCQKNGVSSQTGASLQHTKATTAKQSSQRIATKAIALLVMNAPNLSLLDGPLGVEHLEIDAGVLVLDQASHRLQHFGRTGDMLKDRETADKVGLQVGKLLVEIATN